MSHSIVRAKIGEDAGWWGQGVKCISGLYLDFVVSVQIRDFRILRGGFS